MTLRPEESGELDVLRQRQLEWHRQFADPAQSEPGGLQLPYCSSRLEAEHHNLRAALEGSQAAPGRVEKGLRLAGAAVLAYLQSDSAATRNLCEESQPIGRQAGPPTLPDTAIALPGLGNAATEVGDDSPPPGA